MANLKLYKKEEKGITLIALIITIIVLLILAGISINAIVGENGVIVKAKWSDFVSEYEAVNEQKEIYRCSEQVNKYVASLNKKTVLTEEELFKLYPVKGEKIDISSVSNTLRETVKQLDGLEGVKLYEVDFTKINAKAKRRYVVNLKTGTLYSIPGESYKSKIWHTPRLWEHISDEEYMFNEPGTYSMTVNAGAVAEWIEWC